VTIASVESVSTSDALVRPWKTATLVVSAVAVTELVLLLGIALVAFGRPMLEAQGSVSGKAASAPEAKAHSKRISAAAAPRAAAAPARRRETLGTPKLARTETSVLILNGNGIAGAAAAESEAVRRKGYIVADVGNAKRTDYSRSVVMYRPGYKPEAARLARDLRVKTVSPLDGLRAGDLMGAHAAVVIGSR